MHNQQHYGVWQLEETDINETQTLVYARTKLNWGEID